MSKLPSCAPALVTAILLVGCQGAMSGPAVGSLGAARLTIRVVVMDPLADALACDCVKGFAQRRYPQLCRFLSQRLGQPVEHVHAEELTGAMDLAGRQVDLIIGKYSLVIWDAAETATPVRPIAMLTDKAGRTDLTGLFVVRADDPARSLSDLRGRRIMLGPMSDREKHSEAITAMHSAGLAIPPSPAISRTCNEGALAVVDGKADAAVISSYAMPLLEGCDTIDKGSLRILECTSPVPFVTVFATPRVSAADEQRIVAAMLATKTDTKLLAEMESRDGFLAVSPTASQPAPADDAPPIGWTDWRGLHRDAISPCVPTRLPAKAKFLWRQPLSGHSPGGVAATSRFVAVSDKDAQGKNDIWRCLEAGTGKQLWELKYPADKELDYSNSPRATPVIHQGRTSLLGAMGDLHCVALAGGKVLWKTNIAGQFGAELPQWGYCSTPLIADDVLIVNPGGPNAALVALDPQTGKVIWKTPGGHAAYASFIVGRFGSVRQIVGYDATTLGGWDVRTGRRLWEVKPGEENDFNVPTPVAMNGRLLLATENNGTRLYEFDTQGRIRPEPIARNEDLSPDTTSPVALDGHVFGFWNDLFCLDAASLKTVWRWSDEHLDGYVSLIAGNGRVLLCSTKGELLLFDAGGDKGKPLSRLTVFDYQADMWSHPALVGERLYLRSQKEIVCLSLTESH